MPQGNSDWEERGEGCGVSSGWSSGVSLRNESWEFYLIVEVEVV